VGYFEVGIVVVDEKRIKENRRVIITTCITNKHEVV
jgi:hypothetical protein